MKCFEPNIAIHPGETLRETLEELKMSQAELSQRTGLAKKTINEIIKGKAPITTDTAIKLSAVFGMSSEFWNNLERNYQETISRIKANSFLDEESKLLAKYTCYKELAESGFVEKTSSKREKALSLMNFFGVSSLSLVPEMHSIAYRKSESERLSRENLAAWLRCGELAGEKVQTADFDREKIVASLGEIRALTTEKPEVFSRKLVDLCASFGVALVYLPYFKNTYVNGSTRWLNQDKALIQISLRLRYLDIFWFSFFHELGHLLKHGKKEQFIEYQHKDHVELKEKEKEADNFASDLLIPKREYEEYCRLHINPSDSNIISFARKIGVHHSIVAGRLAKDTNLWNRMSRLRTKLELKKQSA